MAAFINYQTRETHTLLTQDTTVQDQVISLRGCRVHNLKNINIDIPSRTLVAICGLSGSGKSSLALDTLYAEGQRCYIESFSAYTRQFLERLDKPDCEEIKGIPPAIAVTRSTGSKSNRSTVATATEIADYLRLAFAKAASLHCIECGSPVTRDSPEEVGIEMTTSGAKARAMVAFPVWLPNRQEANEILLGLQREGYVRLILDEFSFRLSDDDRSKLAEQIQATGCSALVVVDRLSESNELKRWTESIETAMTEGNGRAVILTEVKDDIQPATGERIITVDGKAWKQRTISRELRCDTCDIDYQSPVPRLFNFNNPLGACARCEGFGEIVVVDMSLVVPNPDLSLSEGAIAPWNTPSYRHELDELLELADDYDIPTDVPYKKLRKKHRRLIQKGVPERNFGGLDGFFAWLDRKKYKMHIRIFASRYRSYKKCPDCDGKRFKPETLAYRLGRLNISQWLNMRADEAKEEIQQLILSKREENIAAEPLHQISQRIGFLQQVGLGYLQLDRTLRTLSGGETQRVALTSTLGSSLVNMLYVLDEPTAGLHPHDVEQLCGAILQLRDRGNSVILVEHEETMIRLAEHVIEIGPGAGKQGGEVVFQGSPDEMIQDKTSHTGQFLAGERGWAVKERMPRKPKGFLSLKNANGNNLKDLTVEFPLGVLCLVTGISGSGKSSLIQDTLFGAIQKRKKQKIVETLPFSSIGGLSQIKDCLLVDQSPISRSARSAPVTFIKAFDPIRKVFANTTEAKSLGYEAGHFSFNSDRGHCTQCEGSGLLQIDMQFMADITMQCPTCQGSRYRDEILKVRYRDRSISDVLNMSVSEAYAFFRGCDKIQERLKKMIDVGLGYIKLGQPATTLSSGEAQRLKLAAFLATASKSKTLFILDEPTTGLHFADIIRLIDCFDALIADGHSLLVVEHNALLMQAADYIIDLGPGAAEDGGSVVAHGTPDQVANVQESLTGQVLSKLRSSIIG